MLQVSIKGDMTAVKDILAMAKLEERNGSFVFEGEALTARARLALMALDEENVMPESISLAVWAEKDSALFTKNSIAFWNKYGATLFKAFRQPVNDVTLVDEKWAGIWNLLALTKDTPTDAISPLLETMRTCSDALVFGRGFVELTLKGLKVSEVMMVLDFLTASVKHCETRSVRFGQSEEQENEAFMFRTLCNTIGLSGAEYSELRKWGLEVLEGNSAWRFGAPSEQPQTQPQTAVKKGRKKNDEQ